jgi:hypothetical protein
MEEAKKKAREFWNLSQTKYRQNKRKETKCWKCPKRTNDEKSTTGPCQGSKKWLTIGFLHCCPNPSDNSKEMQIGGK